MAAGVTPYYAHSQEGGRGGKGGGGEGVGEGRRRGRNADVQLAFCFFIQSATPGKGMAPPTFRVALPFSIKAERFVS